MAFTRSQKVRRIQRRPDGLARKRTGPACDVPAAAAVGLTTRPRRHASAAVAARCGMDHGQADRGVTLRRCRRVMGRWRGRVRARDAAPTRRHVDRALPPCRTGTVCACVRLHRIPVTWAHQRSITDDSSSCLPASRTCVAYEDYLRCSQETFSRLGTIWFETLESFGPITPQIAFSATSSSTFVSLRNRGRPVTVARHT